MKTILQLLLVFAAFSSSAQFFYSANGTTTNEQAAVSEATSYFRDTDSPAKRARGLELLTQHANKGSATAALLLAKYYQGTDPEKANLFFQIVAKKGNAEARQRLADYQAYRFPSQQNSAGALRLRQLASANGSVEAKRELARCYAEGRLGVAQNMPMAFTIWEELEDYWLMAQHTPDFTVEKYKWLRVGLLAGKNTDLTSEMRQNLFSYVGKTTKGIIDQGEAAALNYYNRRYSTINSRPELESPRAEDFRVVTNQVFNIRKSVLWKFFSGDVFEKVGNLATVRKAIEGRGMIAVRNLPEDAVAGKHVNIAAMRVGNYVYSGVLLELWDCGTMPMPANK